ncbi:endonuclease [Parafrankia colletiae]|uniref:Endonuclease n=1 Tax=Parafrankia colletiae TaxID=573497 RepID=A0A1S1Q6U1_9ACTN|nr:endonuclease/exonuclease/phosphatase family protein [Parafrankia colletiae]MCK9899749.1 endonuclease/exonuclease/phosphatase family protein [Frankia sp. Cpl3]OHV30608.1 endonuclease [Parafrankia colletiae]
MRVGSFNAMHGLSLADGRVEVDRFTAAIADLDCDILGLQEMDLAQPRSGGGDLAATAAAALGAADSGWRFAPTVYGTPGHSWRPAEGVRADGEPAYGIALVSRLPVRRWWVLPLGRAPVRAPILVPGGSRRARLILFDDEPRVALAAVVETPAGPLTVVTTHLSFAPGWNAVQLRRLVGLLRGLDGPVLLLGDLNLPGRLPTALTGWRRLAAHRTYPAHAPRVQLDHMLARGPVGPVTATEARRTAVSDHLALLADIRR